MKNILTTLLVLFALVVNAQSDCFGILKSKLFVYDSIAFFYNYDTIQLDSRKFTKETGNNHFIMTNSGCCINCESIKDNPFETTEVMQGLLLMAALDTKEHIWMSHFHKLLEDTFVKFYEIKE